MTTIDRGNDFTFKFTFSGTGITSISTWTFTLTVKDDLTLTDTAAQLQIKNASWTKSSLTAYCPITASQTLAITSGNYWIDAKAKMATNTTFTILPQAQYKFRDSVTRAVS
jgi:hypothetical protein